MSEAPHLSALTTLEVGGPTFAYASVSQPEEALEQVKHAKRQGWPWLVVGGGSNILAADSGFPGLVLRWEDRDLQLLTDAADRVRVQVGGGYVWDELVAHTVERGWAGLECLSGIPGRVGAAPMQNIGAYGQEVSELIEHVDVLEWETGKSLQLSAEECDFGYRTSRFKRDWRGRFLIKAVCFQLRPGGSSQVRYAELKARIGDGDPDLHHVRQTVLSIRREKSMVWDRQDPNHRSAGSFFLNPILPESAARQILEAHPEAPSWPAPEGVKLSAAWLIGRSGFTRGWGEGAAGLSSNHVLALVNRGGARASDLLALARQVREGVAARFGVWLHPEPELVGFGASAEELLS